MTQKWITDTDAKSIGEKNVSYIIKSTKKKSEINWLGIQRQKNYYFIYIHSFSNTEDIHRQLPVKTKD